MMQNINKKKQGSQGSVKRIWKNFKEKTKVLPKFYQHMMYPLFMLSFFAKMHFSIKQL